VEEGEGEATSEASDAVFDNLRDDEARDL